MFNLARHISKFLDRIQNNTQKRFIKQAKKRGIPPDVANKMTDLEKEYVESTHELRDL